MVRVGLELTNVLATKRTLYYWPTATGTTGTNYPYKTVYMHNIAQLHVPVHIDGILMAVLFLWLHNVLWVTHYATFYNIFNNKTKLTNVWYSLTKFTFCVLNAKIVVSAWTHSINADGGYICYARMILQVIYYGK